MTTKDSEFRTIPIASVHVDEERNCRDVIQPHTVVELASSIKKEGGLIQPVIVIPYGKDGFDYHLVAGHRRLRAHTYLGLDAIDSIINRTIDGEDPLQMQLFNLSENLFRQDLNMLEEAKAMQLLLESGLTEGQLGEQLNKSISWVQTRKYLLELPERVQEEASAGWLTDSIVRDLRSVFHKKGHTDCLKAAALTRDAKARGDKVHIKKRKHNPLRKRKASKEDFIEMQVCVEKAIGAGLVTRTLAFAMGEISQYEYWTFLSLESHKMCANGLLDQAWEVPDVDDSE